MEIMKLFFTPDEELYNKRIDEYFDEEVLNSNFWMYWRTMFAFENWHSALEMKLYIKRFIHHVGGLPDFTALRFTKYNQYESMILPMVKYLESFGVVFHYNTKVINVEFEIEAGRKLAKKIDIIRDGEADAIDLTENDLVFITMVAAWRILHTEARTNRLSSRPRSAKAADGICGGRSLHRIHPSDIRTNSVTIRSSQTG